MKRQTAATDPNRQMELSRGYYNLTSPVHSEAEDDRNLAAFMNIFHPERGVTSIEDAKELRSETAKVQTRRQGRRR